MNGSEAVTRRRLSNRTFADSMREVPADAIEAFTAERFGRLG